MGGEVVVCLCRGAVVAWSFVLPETVDGLPDFVDGEGALFQLPPLGVVEDPREAVDFGLGVWVQCVLGGRVLPEEAVLGGLEHCGWVVDEGAVLLPDRGNGAVGVSHGVVEVADGLVGEFMLRIPFLFLGDALLPVDVPPLRVCPDVGYLRPAVVYLAAGFRGCRCGGGSRVVASHARGHGACPLGPWVVGRRLCGGVAGSCRRRLPCAWL